MKKTALVTGVAGFIGSAVAKKLIDKGYELFGIDNLSTGFLENVPHRCEFIEGDIQDPDILKPFDGFNLDVIFHIAGQSSGEVSFSDPIYDLQTNAQSTIMLLDHARQNSCRNFVYAGTMSVYGNPSNPLIPVKESHDFNPLSFYAIGKIASEAYMKIYSQHYGIRCTSLRLFNVYGPGQNLQNLKQGMVSIFLAQALKTGVIKVRGSLNRFRDQVYIDDVVRAFLKASTHEGASLFNAFNVCTGHSIKVSDVIEELERNISIKEVIEEPGTPGDQFGIIGDPQIAELHLGFVAKETFQTGMQKMISMTKNREFNLC